MKKVKVIFLMGIPGSGKTYLFKKILEHYNHKIGITYRPGFAYMQVSIHPRESIYMLGAYDESTFSGTDKLSMSVQPTAIQFIKDMYSGTILIEGDRLCNEKFFNFCKENTDFKLFCLNVPMNVCRERRILRGKMQNEPWLKGRQTKVVNLLAKFKVIMLNSEDDFHTNIALQTILCEIKNEGTISKTINDI